VGFLFCFLCAANPVNAQTKCWVFFKSKPAIQQGKLYVSESTLANRSLLGLPLVQPTDLPLNPNFIASVTSLAKQPICISSKWLNAVSIFLQAEQAAQIAKLPFVDSVRPFRTKAQIAQAEIVEGSPKTSLALQFLRSDAFTNAGLNGAGVKVGIIDCGFKGADQNDATAALVKNGQVAAMKDFVTPQNTDLYHMHESSVDFHGARVLANVGGLGKNGQQTGLATAATYYLARSDHGRREFRQEEDLWISALEWMDSLGVRLVNTSLGYTNEFDDSSENYNIRQMDGMTTQISRAAGLAARQKGMILVIAAGNEGSSQWQIVSAPADCKDVISVGAVTDELVRENYSSIGNPEVGFIKPDVVAWSTDGTSFSAPVIAGMLACMLQKKPSLQPKEAMDLLHKAATLFPFANNYIGYGVPQAARVLSLLDGKSVPEVQAVKATGNKIRISFNAPVPNEQQIVILHKNAQNMVIMQEIQLGRNKPDLRIDHYPGAISSTVYTGFAAREIQWPTH